MCVRGAAGLLQVIAPVAGSLVRFICSRRSAGTDLKPPNKRG